MVGGKPQLCRAQFEPALRAKHPWLTFDQFLLLIRLGRWSSAKQLSEYFGQPQGWSATLRRLLMREGTVTAHSWRSCFKYAP